jgi:RHS repeat-associated protein
VVHTRGPLLEETHYYPFGLMMAGISSKALNGVVENKRGFNGNELQSKEFFDQSGLEFYDFNARSYDQQIGRFLHVDPKSANAPDWSPYRAFYDNPIKYIDPNGQLEYESAEAFAKANKGKTWDKDRGKGDWLKSDREMNTDVWGKANKFNLQQKDGFKQYNSIEQRTGFYGWYAVQEYLRGGETKWAGAAFIVAKQMTLMDVFYNSGDLQMIYGVKDAKDLNGFANAGNKAIFDDIFDNLRDNLNGVPKKGAAATQWDAQTLHREQFDVVQPVYEAWIKYNPKLNYYLQEFASGKGLSRFMRMPSQLKFEGKIMNAQNRYNHGMNKNVPFYEMLQTSQIIR